MERRKFLIGAGSAAVGSSALIGSGAFTSVDANRDFDVKIATDENAYLRLSPNSEYASLENGSIKLDFAGGNGQNGDGLNGRADSRFKDVFTIENQGTQTVYVWTATAAPTSGGAQSTELIADNHVPNDENDNISDDPVDITFPASESKNQEPKRTGTSTTQGGYVKLAPGDSVNIDFQFFVTGDADEKYRPSDNLYQSEIQFRANEDAPDSTDDYTDSELEG